MSVTELKPPRFVLRSDVVVEPLVQRWYAWGHLIAPMTAALNVARRHLPMMRSYVASPAAHQALAAKPELRGGPFLDLASDRSAEVQRLIDETHRSQAPLLELAEAIAAAWKLLRDRADGRGLSALYRELPDALRGLVELVYTPAGGPDLRPIEALLYQSRFADDSAQSALLRRLRGDQRSFALSTPRLDEPGAIHLRKPFRHPAYDLLGRLRSQPMTMAEIVDGLGLAQADVATLQELLVPAPAGSGQRPASETARRRDTARWRYCGHACVLVESPAGVSVLLDPVLAYDSGAQPERFTFADLPAHIDYAVLTHNHQDHVMLETLLALRWKIGTIVVPRSGGSLVDPSLARALRSIGFQRVVELDSLEDLVDRDVRITALPFLGEHADLDIRTKAAWLVRANGFGSLFAADSNNLDPHLYDHLSKSIGSVDQLFIGMECVGAPMSWLYGCLLPDPIPRDHDQSRRLNGSDAERGMALVQSLGARAVRVYAMGAEPWLSFISSIDPGASTVPRQNADALIQACRARGIEAELLYGRAERFARTSGAATAATGAMGATGADEDGEIELTI